MLKKIIKIPSTWVEIKLSEVSRIYDGTHQTPVYTDCGIPFYSVEHITANNFSDTKYISKDVFESESQRVRIERGDVLMTRIGDIGTAKYVDWDVEASFYVTLALIKCKKSVDSKFLTYFINSNLFKKEVWAKTIHVAFPNKINLGDIGRCSLVLPPPPEQGRIATVLETWDKAIEKLAKKIEMKKKIKKGLMQRLLTGKLRLSGFNEPWQAVKLSDVCPRIRTGKLDANAMVQGGKYRFYTCAKNYYRINDYAFDTEALLVSGNGANVGYIHYYSGKFNAYQRTYVLDRFTSDITFTKYILDELLHQRISEEKCDGNTPYIKMDTLTDMKFKMPKTNDEQVLIANVIATADGELNKLNRKLNKLKEQKKYLLNNLITGAIRTPESMSVKA